MSAAVPAGPASAARDGLGDDADLLCMERQAPEAHCEL